MIKNKATEAEEAKCQLRQGALGGLLRAEPWKLAAVALGVLAAATLARQLSPLGGPLPPACAERTHKLNGRCPWTYSLSSILIKCSHTPEDSSGRSVEATCHKVFSVLRFWSGDRGPPEPRVSPLSPVCPP